MKKLYVLLLTVSFLCSAISVVALQKESMMKINSNKKTSQLVYDNMIPSIIEQINESMMEVYLKDLVTFGPHPTTSPACDKVAEYIFDKFESFGLDVRYQDWYYNIFSYGRNIEATVQGLSNDIYIISAHYDTWRNSPGADDDAAGVATVLTAAYILSQYSFNHTIRFVLFSGEEQGLRGSGFYSEEAYNNCDDIILDINLDMIGYASNSEEEGKIRIYTNTFSSWIVDDYTIPLSQRYAELLDFEVLVLDDPTGHSSDYQSFWKFGYDALFYHEYKWNSYVHTPEDTIENMNIHYATKVARFAIATIAELSISPIIYNSQPELPDITGPSSSKINVNQTYTTHTTDPDGDNLYYIFDWGDGTNSGWLGPYNSGEKVQVSHIWTKKGQYIIKVKAKDIHGIQSNWSNPPLPITIKPILKIFELLIQRFPNIFPILRHVLGY